MSEERIIQDGSWKQMAKHYEARALEAEKKVTALLEVARAAERVCGTKPETFFVDSDDLKRFDQELRAALAALKEIR